jgi:hypothetical protein
VLGVVCWLGTIWAVRSGTLAMKVRAGRGSRPDINFHMLAVAAEIGNVEGSVPNGSTTRRQAAERVSRFTGS